CTTVRAGGCAVAVPLTASGLPAGVTAAFNAASTSGNSSTLTFTASATATTGTANVTLTGASGTLSHNATVSLTVNAGGGGGGDGGVTVTPVVNSSGPWFNEEAIQLGNTAPLTALSITV